MDVDLARLTPGTHVAILVWSMSLKSAEGRTRLKTHWLQGTARFFVCQIWRAQ